MKLLTTFVAVAALLASETTLAATTRLQTVNLNDKEMSTEGGEARLYRVTEGKNAFCRVEAIHFGETGKAIFVFDFTKTLTWAERREYRYNQPIYMASKMKQSLVGRTTLATPEGRKVLGEAFEKYESFFDSAQLAKCTG